MQNDRIDTMTAVNAPEETFTGSVIISGYFRREVPSRLAGATVNFSPGSRTPWKVNSLGQTLIVTKGAGLAKVEGGEAVELQSGDIIWFPPGCRHWEGAKPQTSLIYVAIHEIESNSGVEFEEKVSDEEYHRAVSSLKRIQRDRGRCA
ncbi:cupin domain-containing protein [Mesorhizobium sp. SB112]|uniref:cupin domain-containing protein n=1 Tax=Mesorhizobium sp. SB112 TaxID=3151853 RepID=UPI003266E548